MSEHSTLEDTCTHCKRRLIRVGKGWVHWWNFSRECGLGRRTWAEAEPQRTMEGNPINHKEQDDG